MAAGHFLLQIPTSGGGGAWGAGETAMIELATLQVSESHGCLLAFIQGYGILSE